MLAPRKKLKGIEVSHWKVSDVDDFRGINIENDTDIIPFPLDECYPDSTDEHDD
jgi:hypothetical protein